VPAILGRYTSWRQTIKGAVLACGVGERRVLSRGVPFQKAKIMPVASKLSQTYDRGEDRLLLICEEDQGHVFRLWLTQRMLNDVVLALTGWLEGPAPGQLATVPDPVTQVWQQAAAVVQYVPASPVRVVAPATTEGLVQNIELSRGAGSYGLTLSLASGANVTLPFNSLELRQWLSMLHGLYQTSGWPLTVWPDWFNHPIATVAPGVVN
jgi:hypothetical protein